MGNISKLLSFVGTKSVVLRPSQLSGATTTSPLSSSSSFLLNPPKLTTVGNLSACKLLIFYVIYRAINNVHFFLYMLIVKNIYNYIHNNFECKIYLVTSIERVLSMRLFMSVIRVYLN